MEEFHLGIGSLTLIALSLSFDSFAVSVSSGMSMCRKHIKIIDTFKIAFTLAIFQALMPVIGWFLCSTIKESIEQFDHWIAFVLLGVLGGRMVWEGYHPHIQKIRNPTKWSVLIPIAVATSIDALAVGISFAFIYKNMLLPAFIIGVVTFGVSLSGLYMGKKTGTKLAGSAEIAGGFVLIIIGVKILIEHLTA